MEPSSPLPLLSPQFADKNTKTRFVNTLQFLTFHLIGFSIIIFCVISSSLLYVLTTVLILNAT